MNVENHPPLSPLSALSSSSSSANPVLMAGTNRERSSGGCWTCKLRKKKCDEGHPECAICLSFGIECHGYGARPWVSGGLVEKSHLEDWRKRVKEASNHKRKLKNQYIRNVISAGREHESGRVPGYSDAAENALTPHSLPLQNEVSNTDLNEDQPARLLSGGYEHLTRSNESSILQPPTPFRGSLQEKEAGLLMHYLDYVFPLQYPFYKHSVVKGGRGWLLSLLMQLEPLYHSALSVSTYHQHFEQYLHDHELHFGSLEDARELLICSRLESQLTEHNLSLSRLSKLLSEMEDLDRNGSGLHLTRYVELIACMATLISLEILEGRKDSWQIHLTAASCILPRAHEAFQSEQVNDLSDTHKEAYHFFSSALKWYQFQSCAQAVALFVSSCTEFQLSKPSSNFTGCEDWVTQEIMNIIELSHWKETMKAKKQLSNRELSTRALEIDTKLKSEINALSTRIDGTFPVDYFDNPSAYVEILVTRIFAYSALIFLYTIESGPCPDIPEIHSNVSRTIDAFKALPQAQLIRNLSWPLCIAGSMAAGEQQDVFLEIAAKAKINRYPFGSSRHALAIVEECWRMRGSGEGEEGCVDWRVAMRNLGLNILLA